MTKAQAREGTWWTKARVMLCAALLLLLVAGMAGAVPDLQLFIPGATYDATTETWITTASSFDLQVIGANDVIEDVQVSAALVPSTTDPSSGTITMTGGTGPQSSFTQGTPLRGDGNPLPSHGIFPPPDGTWFVTLPVGDFTPQYTVYDMQPGSSGSALGEIKTIHVEITGFPAVHFDAFDHTVVNDNHVRYVFAPFSHDAEQVPEPGTFALLGSGALSVVGFGLRARRQRPGSN